MEMIPNCDSHIPVPGHPCHLVRRSRAGSPGTVERAPPDHVRAVGARRARRRDGDRAGRSRELSPSPTALDDAFRELLGEGRLDELHAAVIRAELAGELSELQALTWQATLALCEHSVLALDYLEMAEAIAVSEHERAMVAEHLAIYDLVSGDPRGAAERCLAALAHGRQTEGLWLNLLVALAGMGELDALDAVLRCLARLERNCTALLVERMCAEPALDAVCARPAFRPLLDCRAAV